tara:strand:+ start:253 stop:390 length:138 start_codon:yes stop_codon:yes gene_type:complete
MIGRYHAPRSIEDWIVLETDDPKKVYVLLKTPQRDIQKFVEANSK